MTDTSPCGHAITESKMLHDNFAQCVVRDVVTLELMSILQCLCAMTQCGCANTLTDNGTCSYLSHHLTRCHVLASEASAEPCDVLLAMSAFEVCGF